MSTDAPSTRAEAVEWAARVREARRSLMESVKAGEIDVAIAVERASTSADLFDVWAVSVVEVVPGVGKVGCRRALRDVGIDEHGALGSLDPDQVAALEGVLG